MSEPTTPIQLQLLRSGRFQRRPEHRVRREAPTDFLMIWVVDGSGWAERNGTAMRAGAGRLLTFEPGVPHAYGSSIDSPWDILWAHFSGASAPYWLAEMRGSRRAPDPALPVLPALARRFEELVDLHARRTEATDRLGDALLVGLLGLIRYHLTVHRLSPAQADPRLTRLEAFIRQRHHEPLAAADLADAAGLSTRQLNRLTRSALGVTAVEMLTRYRIERAGLLLRETPMTVQAVALEVGFEDPFHFSRVFKRVVGHSPREHRRASE